MNRRFLALSAALAALALGSGSAVPAGPDPALAVLRCHLRFAERAEPRSRILLQGDLTAGPGLASFDPRTGPFRVSVGPLVLLDGPPYGGIARHRDARSGWRLEIRGPFGGRGRVSVRMNAASGLFRLAARGFEAGELLTGGPAAVPVVLVVGEETYGTTLDFEEGKAGRWSYRLRGAPIPPPGGGGGGGGQGPVPGGFTTIAQGDVSGITSFRFEVVRDAAAWAAVWAQHAGSGSPPSVDFSTEMALGIWLGQRPTGGYSVTFLQVTPGTVLGMPEPAPQGAYAVIVEDQPGWTPVPPGPTHPFHIVRAPRVEGPVIYELATRSQ